MLKAPKGYKKPAKEDNRLHSEMVFKWPQDGGIAGQVLIDNGVRLWFGVVGKEADK